jgi:hypothetical protein
VSSLTDARLALAETLAGEPADLTTGPSLDALKALPAVIVEPAPASWIDASSDSGPGRMVRYGVVAHVVVNAQEPIGALADLEDCVERVLERVPPGWRIDRAEGPQRVNASGGELTALRATLMFSTRYSIDSII